MDIPSLCRKYFATDNLYDVLKVPRNATESASKNISIALNLSVCFCLRPIVIVSDSIFHSQKCISTTESHLPSRQSSAVGIIGCYRKMQNTEFGVLRLGR